LQDPPQSSVITTHDLRSGVSTFTGGIAEDAYVAASVGVGANGVAVRNVSLNDAGGNNQLRVSAQESFASQVGVQDSVLQLGTPTSTGFVAVQVNVFGMLYPAGIKNSQISLGSGGSLTTVAVTASAGGDNREFWGGTDSSVSGGEGGDILLLSVQDPTPSGQGANVVRTLAGSAINLFGGDDGLVIDAFNPGRRTVAVSGGILDLGGGNNSLTVTSSENGLVGTSVATGDGIDQVVVTAGRVGADRSSLNLGAGADLIVFRGGSSSGVSAVDSLIVLGPGDDMADLESGSGTVDGGDGFDTVSIGIAKARARVRPGATPGQVSVVDVLDSRTQFTLIGVESL
jgi:hypothetical protein